LTPKCRRRRQDVRVGAPKGSATIVDVVEAASPISGLSDAEMAFRLKRDGPNTLPRRKL
jgi:hypothetical protein